MPFFSSLVTGIVMTALVQSSDRDGIDGGKKDSLNNLVTQYPVKTRAKK